MATCRAATPTDLERLIPLIDQEFVFGKGRRISLKQRFPDVYSTANVDRIYVAELGGEIVSSLACKEFRLLRNDSSWRGAMIGAVCTRPDIRGRGIATKLLKYCTDGLASGGLDFAVLWTAQSDFYKRLGWVCCDSGLMGSVEISAKAANCRHRKAVDRIESVDFSRIEQIRRHWVDCFVSRDELAYRHIPLPAESTELFCQNENSAEHSAYALTGVVDDTRIVYEMLGEPTAFAPLWSDLSSGYSRILINDVSGSRSERWLTQNVTPLWEAKRLAMWLPISLRVSADRFANWYIPYFDRI